MSIQDIVINGLQPLDNLISEITELASCLENVTVMNTNRIALLVSTEIYRLADLEMQIGTLSSAYHQDYKELDRECKELVKAKLDDTLTRRSMLDKLKLADECSEWKKCLETKKVAAKEAIMILKKIVDSKREGM